MKSKPVIPEELYTEEVQQKLHQWYGAKTEAARLVAAERSLREELVAYLFPGKDEGSQTYVLPDGAELTCLKGLDRKLCNLDKMDKGETHPVREKTVVTLDLRAYKALPEEEQWKFDLDYLEIKPKTPSLKLTPAAS